METTQETVYDPYLQNKQGLSPLGQHGSSPRAFIPRVFEVGICAGNIFQDFLVPDQWMLCKGAAVGLDSDGLCRHAIPGYGLQGFLGFIEGTMDNNSVKVRTRGSVILKISGVTPEDRGRTVYALDANEFSLDTNAGGLKVGIIKYVQGKDACVAFASFQDSKGPDTKISGPQPRRH